MFCSNCGNKLKDTDKFCSSCGSRVESVEEEIEDVYEEDEDIYDEEDESDIFEIIGGEEVNITEIIDMFERDKEAAVKYLIEKTDIGSWEAKDIIDEAYQKIYGSEPEVTEEPKKSFWEKAKEHNQVLVQQSKDAAEKRREAIAQQKEEDRRRIQQMDCEGTAYCPKCHSTSLSAHKKGFGVGKAVIGGIAGVATGGAIGLVGLAAGNMGAKKIRVTCMKCGHQFWAGKR